MEIPTVPLAPFRINAGSFTRLIARVVHVYSTKYIDTINIHQTGALFVRATAIFLSSEATKTCPHWGGNPIFTINFSVPNLFGFQFSGRSSVDSFPVPAILSSSFPAMSVSTSSISLSFHRVWRRLGLWVWQMVRENFHWVRFGPVFFSFSLGLWCNVREEIRSLVVYFTVWLSYWRVLCNVKIFPNQCIKNRDWCLSKWVHFYGSISEMYFWVCAAFILN